MTAVETIISKIKSVKPTQFCSIETILEWCEQAKEMEKQQITDAYGDGLNAYRTDFCNRDEYFAKTYGSKGSDETKTDKI